MAEFNDGLAIQYATNKSQKFNFEFQYDDATPDYTESYELGRQIDHISNYKPITYLSSIDINKMEDSLWVFTRFIKQYGKLSFVIEPYSIQNKKLKKELSTEYIVAETKSLLWNSPLYLNPIRAQYNSNSTTVDVFYERQSAIQYRGFPLYQFYDITSGSISTPIEKVLSASNNTSNAARGLVNITIDGLDLSFFKNIDLMNIKLSATTVMTTINGSMDLSTAKSGEQYEFNFDTGIIDCKYYLFDDVAKIYEPGDEVTFDITISLKYKTGGITFDSYDYSVSYTPAYSAESMKSTFRSSDGSIADVNGYYGIQSTIYMTTGVMTNDVLLRLVKIINITDSQKIIQKNVPANDDFWYYRSNKIKMGDQCRVDTTIYAPWSTTTYKSDIIKTYSIINSYDIKDVSCEIEGPDTVSDDDNYILYNGDGSNTSNNIDMKPVFTDGQAIVSANFKIYGNDKVRFGNKEYDIAVTEETQPTDTYLVAIQTDSTLYDKLFDRKLKSKHRQSFRDKNTLQSYPNVNRYFGKEVINALPSASGVLENGIIYGHYSDTIDSLEDGQPYNLTCIIPETNTYVILAIMSIKTAGFESSYTTYELSNMPNITDDTTQFDVLTKE